MMRDSSLEPKALLNALLKGDAPLEGMAEGEVSRARELAMSIANASPSRVEELSEPLALAVLEASVRARDPRLAEALTGSARKAIAKGAKKALYQLRSLGVEVEPTAEVVQASTTSSLPETADYLPCLQSTLTGSGEQALIVPQPVRGGGLTITQVILSDERGLTELVQRQVSRSSYRKQLRELAAASGPPVVQITLAEARALLAGASALNLKSKTAYPPEAEAFLRHIGVAPHDEVLSLEPPKPDDLRLAAQSPRLFEEPELRPWIPPEPEVRALAAKMDEVLHSPLQLSEAQRSEQLVTQFRAQARAFFTDERRKLYAARLWRMGDFFERTGRPQASALAKAQARILFHAPAEPLPRFCELLFEKVLQLAQRREGKTEPELPQGAPAPPSERRSPGGLILP